MKRTVKLLAGLALFAGLLSSACSLSLPGDKVNDTALATESAQLIQSGRATQTAEAASRPGKTALPPIITATVALPTVHPNETEMPATQELKPSSTPLPSATPIPTFTHIPPTITPTPVPCDQAEFVKDLTIPDGSIFTPGSSFTKTWRIRNSGACAWSSSYAVVFNRGEQMSGSSPIPLTQSVNPGETVDLSVNLVAPSSEGKYRGYWKLMNASGLIFGTGAKNSAFYVDIAVQSANSKYAFDFAANFCNASWTSGAGSLPCPGAAGDAKGYIQRIDNPVLETGAVDNEPALLTVPQAQMDGVIRGKFPLYKVVDGDTFRAILFCAKDAKDCSVKFQLDYVLDGESSIQTAGSWTKTWDGDTLDSVVLDLSSLAGKSVRFILTVFANGEMKDDRAEWLAPRIVHK